MDNFSIVKLTELREKICQKDHVISKLTMLKEQRADLAEETSRLYDILQYEKADVERLEKLGFMSLMYSFLGKKEELISKEKREAIAAAANYTAVYEEMRSVEKELSRCERELKHLERCEEEYEILWAEIVRKKDELINPTERLSGSLSELGASQAKLAEVNEAISAGEKVTASIDTIIEAMIDEFKARRYSIEHDGMLQNAHENMKMADNLYASLGDQLLSFKTELADINVDFAGTVKHYRLIVFSNYLMEEMFDLGIENEFKAARQLRSLRGDVGRVLNSLYSHKEGIERNISNLKMRIEAELKNK